MASTLANGDALISAPELAINIAMMASKPNNEEAGNGEERPPSDNSPCKTEDSSGQDLSVVDISHIVAREGDKKTVPASRWIETLKLETYPLMTDCYHKETYKDSSQIEVKASDGSLLTRSLTTLNYFLHLPTMPFSKCLAVKLVIVRYLGGGIMDYFHIHNISDSRVYTDIRCIYKSQVIIL